MHRPSLAFIAALAVPALHAQSGTPVQSGNEYVIQGVFSPVIADARKIDLRPQRLDTIVPEQPVGYQVLGVQAAIAPRVDSIAPARLSVQTPRHRIYKGYVKAGFGLYTTPLGEVYFDQGRSRTNTWGLHAKHFSSNGGLTDTGPSDYSLNRIDAHYTRFLPHHEVGGRLIYDRRRVSHYGYIATDSIEDAIAAIADPPVDALKQVYNDIGFAAQLRSTFTDSTRLAHSAGVEVHAYDNLTGSQETNIRLHGGVGKMEGNEHFGLGIVLDNNAYRAELGPVLGEARQNGILLGLTPHVRTRGPRYDVTVGAGIHIDGMGRTTFHFFPHADLSYRLFDDILVPYAGVTGERRRNSLRSLTRENPWLGGAPSLANSSLKYDAYGGLRGSFSRHVGFDVRVSLAKWEDMPLFINIPMEPFGDRMGVVYDRVGVTTVSGELRYRDGEALSFMARAEVLSYTVRLEEKPWNLPPYRIALGGRYSLRDKLIAKVEARFLGSRPAFRAAVPVEPGETPNLSVRTELDGFMDLYLGLEYRYTRRLSVFLDMSNLSASKYERWYRHPVQRGLLLGGATYAF
ncbi:MAG: TonB-dependent receptor [Flavobacteriales bacterium]|nr:TonB-dependent receptor [Flavobacteriales bacterium]